MTASGIGNQVRVGLLWSTASTVVLRGATLLVGIIVARLMSPEEFGVWAVALTVQTVLMTLADLGLSADIVRTSDLRERIPTVATIGLAAGAILTASMAAGSSAIADAMGTPDASSVIFVMSFTMILSGAGVVPFGLLQRRLQQKKLFAVSTADFVVASSITLILILTGAGPMALAISRLAAQAVASVLMYVFAEVRPHFGFKLDEARPALRFGIPVAAANLLSWTLLNIDNVVIARTLGAAALGFYVLAFNVSTWPMTIIGQAVRSVSLAAFSHVTRIKSGRSDSQRDPSLSIGAAISWGAAVPAGVLLAALSNPIVEFLYGGKWIAAAPVLAALGYFGILRVLFDIMATYLMASGKSGQALLIQAAWMLALIPTVVLGVQWYGIEGAAYVHIVTGIILVGPMYIWFLRRAGADTYMMIKLLVVPALAGIPTWIVGFMAATRINTPILALLLGGMGGIAVYACVVYRWAQSVRTYGRSLSSSIPPIDVEAI